MGKSRLSNELLSRLGDRATVLEGRCLPYGEGITFWPVTDGAARRRGDRRGRSARRGAAEAVEPAHERRRRRAGRRPAGRAARARPAAPGSRRRSGPSASCSSTSANNGHSSSSSTTSTGREPTFLDLLEYVVDWIQAPVLVSVSPGRSSARRARTGPAPGTGSALITAGAAVGRDRRPDSEPRRRPGSVLPEPRIASPTRRRAIRCSSRRCCPSLIDDGLLPATTAHGAPPPTCPAISVPPTIQALMDRPHRPPRRRRTGGDERASVVGQVFWWGALYGALAGSTTPGRRRASNHPASGRS